MLTVILVFPGFQLLDLAGPAAVFGAVAEGLRNRDTVLVVSAAGGSIVSSAGVAVETLGIGAADVGGDDTLLVVGGNEAGLSGLVANCAVRDWFAAAAARARRFGSVCTGAYPLAAWGLVDGARVATHWRSAGALASAFPKVDVDPEAMYVEAGRLWTSAGVTAGIDMALAMVERDYGPGLANAIAQRLVLSVRRPGRQSQFSPLIRAQRASGRRYGEVIGHISANLHEALDVETLAALAGETPRTFHRNFAKSTGKTPAAFVLAARLDRVRALLGEGASVKAAASACGFSSAEHLSKAFSSAFGISPSAWRTMNATGSRPSLH